MPGGRGEYYRNKYGGGRSRGRGGEGRGRGARPVGSPSHSIQGGTYEDLKQLLQNIDGRQYPSYHDLEAPGGWRHSSMGFTLYVGRAQSDPFAPPTQCRVQVPASLLQLPSAITTNVIRRMAASDFLLRLLYSKCKTMGADQALRSNGGGGWSGPKGGDLQVLAPTQHVLEQSAVQIDASGNVTIQMTISLPAKGRTVLGRAAFEVMDRILSHLISSLCLPARSDNALLTNVNSVEDQLWLQAQLKKSNLIGFIRNGAILPRHSGVDDRPLTSPNVVPFVSPPSLERSFVLPNAGLSISGMGIPPGLTLICGGGFHGKSTLLQALQWGIYPKIPGDGREFCVVQPNAIRIRAEDGRSVQSVDISSFLNHLPFQKDTCCFSTADASGSTSQASNIVESIELGADTLLIDEDTCATNFMIRDHKMMQLVAPEKEPITPFVRLVRSLYTERNISTIMVIGGAGDYFDVCDQVLLLDSYQCTDATDRAKEIVTQNGGQLVQQASFGTVRSRCLHTSILSPGGKIKVPRNGLISYGDTEIDLSLVEQLVSASQTTAVAFALQYMASAPESSLYELLLQMNQVIDEKGLGECLSAGSFHGGLTRPRLFEVGAAINRIRRQGTLTQK